MRATDPKTVFYFSFSVKIVIFHFWKIYMCLFAWFAYSPMHHWIDESAMCNIVISVIFIDVFMCVCFVICMNIINNMPFHMLVLIPSIFSLFHFTPHFTNLAIIFPNAYALHIGRFNTVYCRFFPRRFKKIPRNMKASDSFIEILICLSHSNGNHTDSKHAVDVSFYTLQAKRLNRALADFIYWKKEISMI